MGRYLIVLIVLGVAAAGFASETDSQKNSAVAPSKEGSTIHPLELMVQTDVKQMMEEAESRLLLRKLMDLSIDSPKWVPEYSSVPRWNVLDESRMMQTGFGLHSRYRGEGLRFISPTEGYGLRVWEQTPELLLDREGARDHRIWK